VIILPTKQAEHEDECFRQQIVREARAYLSMMARIAPPRSLPVLAVDNGRKIL